MTTTGEETSDLLVELLDLRDTLSKLDYFETLDQLTPAKDKAVRQYKRNPTPEKLEIARRAILAIAMLCDLKGNNLGYQLARFDELPALERWKPKTRKSG